MSKKQRMVLDKQFHDLAIQITSMSLVPWKVRRMPWSTNMKPPLMVEELDLEYDLLGFETTFELHRIGHPGLT